MNDTGSHYYFLTFFHTKHQKWKQTNALLYVYLYELFICIPRIILKKTTNTDQLFHFSQNIFAYFSSNMCLFYFEGNPEVQILYVIYFSINIALTKYCFLLHNFLLKLTFKSSAFNWLLRCSILCTQYFNFLCMFLFNFTRFFSYRT